MKSEDQKQITELVAIATSLAGHQAEPIAAVDGTDRIISVRGDQRTILLPGFRKDPRRVQALVNFRDAKDFAAYVKEHALSDVSRIFLDTSDPRNKGVTATAILDYHEPQSKHYRGGFGLHRAVLLAPLHSELKAWIEIVGKAVGQEEFALFIEDHADSVGTPSPADLIKMALDLQGSLTGSYAAKIDLDRSNATLHYEAEDRGTGQVEVPRKIDLRTPMFDGGEDEIFTVNLAMKINSGRPLFTVRMPGLAPKLRDAARHLRDLLAENTGLPVYEASVPTGMEAPTESPKVLSESKYQDAPHYHATTSR